MDMKEEQRVRENKQLEELCIKTEEFIALHEKYQKALAEYIYFSTPHHLMGELVHLGFPPGECEILKNYFRHGEKISDFLIGMMHYMKREIENADVIKFSNDFIR